LLRANLVLKKDQDELAELEDISTELHARLRGIRSEASQHELKLSAAQRQRHELQQLQAHVLVAADQLRRLTWAHTILEQGKETVKQQRNELHDMFIDVVQRLDQLTANMDAHVAQRANTMINNLPPAPSPSSGPSPSSATSSLPSDHPSPRQFPVTDSKLPLSGRSDNESTPPRHDRHPHPGDPDYDTPSSSDANNSDTSGTQLSRQKALASSDRLAALRLADHLRHSTAQQQHDIGARLPHPSDNDHNDHDTNQPSSSQRPIVADADDDDVDDLDSLELAQ
jgi:hypothetical protein